MAGPQTLGRYQIERVLGKGAMGVVYEALDPKLHRKVAIKTILISQLDEETSKDFSLRFVREAHAVARLNHPNIVQVYDFGEEGGVAYLVMEFIRGNELKSVLATNPRFDRKESVRIMCELLDALEFAHEAGVVHRDIKPANVMLDSQGRAKLTDFGVARLTDADRTNAERTQAGTMVGTPAYMSPEQVQGQRVDRRSDIFSAGIILYQFLTGQRPFSGEGAWTIAKKIVQDNPPVPSSLNVGVSPEFDRVVAKALAKDPDQRFSTAREFARALKLAAEGKATVEDEAAPTLVAPPPRETPQALRSGEMELEFWRSIKDSEDAHDFELYVQQFPHGIYASLAGRRIAKLRGLPGAGEDSGTRPLEKTTDGTRLHKSVPRAQVEAKAGRAGGAAQPAVEKTVKLARAPSPEPARTGRRNPLLLAGIIAVVAGLAAYFYVMKPRVQPPGPAIPQAQVPGADEQAKRDAADKAKREAEAQAKRETEAQAKREAEAQAKSEAESKAQADAQAKREAQAKAQREAKSQAKREADLKAKAAAELQATRDAETKAQRDAEAKAQLEGEARAQREAEARAKLAAESSLWSSIKASSDPAEFQKYLSLYPRGQYADPARKRLAALEKEEQRRIAKEKAAAEKARLAEEKRKEQEQRARSQAQAREAEAAQKKKEPEKKKEVIVVPPTF